MAVKIIRWLVGQSISNYLGYLVWLIKGKPLARPSFIKHKTVKKYAREFGIKVLIETGTFFGDMVYATKDIFEKIISIELSETLCKNAQKRFRKYDKISILCGDSGVMLPKVIWDLKETCLFWLDAHYYGEMSAIAYKETPIIEELEAIFQHAEKNELNHIILIDDARFFSGLNDWPSIEKLKTIGLYNRYSLLVQDDIIVMKK